MLDSLYKKLNLILVCFTMLIITLVMAVLWAADIRAGQAGDRAFFQRLSTSLIYQLENHPQNYSSILQSYEDNYSIAGILRDDSGRILYQSKAPLLSDAEALLRDLQNQTALESTSSLEDSVTLQGAVYELKNKKEYLANPSVVVAGEGGVYDLVLFTAAKSIWETMRPDLLFYLDIWVFSCAGVITACRLVLKKAMQPTENVLKSQKEFVAAASHELKSPLAVILANVEKLCGCEINDPRIQSALRTMDLECMRMSKLIQDMLLLASSDAKTWTPSKSDVDVDTLLINLYETYEAVCIKEHITLELKLSDASYPALYTDRERLFQILCIYMDNAVSHSRSQSGIQLGCTVSGKEITFSVTDHGKGIAEADKPFIFDRFYCADKSHTDKSHFGLGLSIADELANMLGGKAGFKDTKGGGADFYVTLPL